MGLTSILEEEIDAFMECLPVMLEEHENEWTVFKHGKALGFYPTEMDAINAGYKELGNVPMLAIQVSQEYIEYGRYGKPHIVPDWIMKGIVEDQNK